MPIGIDCINERSIIRIMFCFHKINYCHKYKKHPSKIACIISMILYFDRFLSNLLFLCKQMIIKITDTHFKLIQASFFTKHIVQLYRSNFEQSIWCTNTFFSQLLLSRSRRAVETKLRYRHVDGGTDILHQTCANILYLSNKQGTMSRSL
jgi:hypothetical protein